ncbi:MAG: hypothetical protein IPJ77_21590 [Planctomycetes bacterium]|nr:hypothetical protein [Planctomycetota bacterium]
MSTQGTTYNDPTASSLRKSTTDGRPAMDASESSSPELKVRLRQMVDDGKSRVSAWKSGVQDGIREKPIQSVLIAAALGAVVGVILGRRSR